MQTARYIRHEHGARRASSDTPDLFSAPVKSVSYQDVIKFSALLYAPNGEQVSEPSYTYTMGKRVFPKNYELPNSPQRWLIVFVTQGNLYFGKKRLAAGDFVVVPPSHTHTLSSKNENPTYYWCTTDDEWVVQVLLSCGYQAEEIMSGHADHPEPIVDIFEKAIYYRHQWCDIRIWFMAQLTCLISYFSKNIVRTQKVSDYLMELCLNDIEGSNGNLTVNDLANRYHISRRYLYTLFQEHCGTSPMEHIMRIRMQAADKFLLTTDYSIARIAELTGYSDYKHFSRAYKKYHTVLPQQRRKQCRLQQGAQEQEAESSPTGES